MFSLIVQQAKSGSSQRRLLMAVSQQSVNNTCQGNLYPLQSQAFSSIFGGIFNKKKEEEQKESAVTPQKQTTATTQAVEPTKYHKESVQSAEHEEEDIKQKIRDLDRSGPNNLFGKYQRQRKTLKERNTQVEDHLNPALLGNERVSIEKFQNKNFKRGLDQDDQPFPVSPKIGPYIVEKPVFGAKNYYYCQCGLAKDQPFCDGSHKGTLFKPLKFSLDEKSERLHMCGCKLTTQAPFCDGTTCKKILSNEPFQEAQAALAEHQAASTQIEDQTK